MHFKRNVTRRKNYNVVLAIFVVLFFLSYSKTLKGVLVQMQTPLLVYGQKIEESGLNFAWRNVFKVTCPIFNYASREKQTCLAPQDYETQEYILQMEGREDEQSLLTFRQQIEDTNLKQSVSENANQEFGDEELVQTDQEDSLSSNRVEMAKDNTDSEKTDVESDTENLQERKEKRDVLNMELYDDYEHLLKDFYVVDKTTYIDSNELNLEKLQSEDMSIQKDANEAPQILIYHTHAHEEYICDQGSYTVMDAGEELATILRDTYGYQVLHDQGVYDEVRDYAYAKAAPALEQILKQYPSIEVVIDLHRDGVLDGVHLVSDLDGMPTAQIMLFNGLSRTKRIGDIEYLKNENRSGNLAFSFQLEKVLKEYYPGISRKIYLKGYRYNMQYRKRSLLVELGAQTNTKEEVHRSLNPLAFCIDCVLSNRK